MALPPVAHVCVNWRMSFLEFQKNFCARYLQFRNASGVRKWILGNGIPE